MALIISACFNIREMIFQTNKLLNCYFWKYKQYV